MEMLRSSAIATSKQLQDPFADGTDVFSRCDPRRLDVAARECVEDAAVRVKRCMRSLVRLQPLLARRAEHVPDNGEHRREELVLRSVADDLVEARVLFHVRLARGDLPFLRGEDLAELGQLRVADARRGQRGECRFDEATELDDIGDAVATGDQAVQRPHEIVRCHLTDERATTGVGLDDAQQLERAQRLPDGGARDLELLGKCTLGRELVARPELALLQKGLDLLDDALVEPAASDGLDDGQFGPPRKLVRWSDQNGKRLRRLVGAVKGVD